MELRHLRYFIAVAEEGSLTLAAEKRLHTAQPSLSRQIRDLEQEVGVQLLSRSAHGIELTPAGRAFLDHARFALGQAEAAVAAARRAAQPSKPTFALGFLTGQEMDWLPEAMRILRDELPNIQATISSQYSPDLAKDLVSGKLDVAFLRPEANMPDLEFRLVTREPLVVVMPSDHRLASQTMIDLHDIVGETFNQCFRHRTDAARNHRCLPGAGGHRDPNATRRRQSRHGDVSGRFHAGRSFATCLCAEFSAVVRDQPPPKR